MKLFAFSILSFLIGFGAAQKKVVCYYGTWATYRHSLGKFDVSNVDPFACTHLIYAFFGIHESGDFRIIDPYLDLEDNWGRGNVKQFNSLKDANPQLKTLAAVGGWNEGSRKFSNVAKDPTKRQRFISTSLKFILSHNFDGLDIDWEYPGQRDGDPDVDKENHAILIRELKQELSKHNLLLTAAVASAEFSANLSYNIPEITKHLDFINVMAYDLHGAWERNVGINAPLYGSSKYVTEIEKQLNVNACIEYWISQGAPAEKIILGTPLYGRSFTLSNPSNTSIGAENTGPGLGGQYSNEPGMIGYNEFCEKLQNEQWTRVWDEEQQVPYAYKDRQWVGYEDLKSLELKVKFAKEKKLGGVMIWSIESDDFHGICGPRYNMLRKINEILETDVSISPTGPPPTSSTTSTTTWSPPQETDGPSEEPGPDGKCRGNGMFSNPNDCSSFIVCKDGRRYDFKCSHGLLFDPTISNCNYEELVDCESDKFN